jgi:hypothetical protein
MSSTASNGFAFVPHTCRVLGRQSLGCRTHNCCATVLKPTYGVIHECSFSTMLNLATTCGINKNNSIGIWLSNQRLHAAAHCFCCNHKAARLALECLHLTWIGVGPCARKLHPLAAARASRVIAVLSHWNVSPSRNAQGPRGPLSVPDGWHRMQQSG